MRLVFLVLTSMIALAVACVDGSTDSPTLARTDTPLQAPTAPVGVAQRTPDSTPTIIPVAVAATEIAPTHSPTPTARTHPAPTRPPTPVPTQSPTATPTAAPTVTHTAVPTTTRTTTATNSPAPTATGTPTPTPAQTATPTPTRVPTPELDPAPTAMPSPVPTATAMPTPTQTPTPRAQWSLSGAVVHGWAYPELGAAVMTTSGRIVGAVVEVVDGPNAGRQATTDNYGRYLLESLEQARVTVRGTAEGFGSVDRTLDLASDQTLTFAISRELPPSKPQVPFPDTDPEWLRKLALDYPHMHHLGNVRVFSDVSPAFSAEHAEHLRLVWDFFNDLYSKNRGNYYDVYYTTNPEVFKKVVPHCPTTFIPGARAVTACYLDYPRWFIIPYQVPDLGTQLHEIGHDFLYATWPPGDNGWTLWDDNKWYIEGTAMYFEGGVFEDQDSLRVPAPLYYCSNLFRRFDENGSLIPLAQLLWRKADDFHADASRSYSQSCMLIDYLETREPGVLYALIDRINSGQIITNDHLVAALLELTGKSISELEEAYQSHARSVILGRE